MYRHQNLIISHFYSSSSRKENNSDRRHQSNIRKLSPFQILGVPESSSYEDVKAAFLRLAMKHHPDTQASNIESKKGKEPQSNQKFVQVRQAFETIKQRFQKKSINLIKKDSDNYYQDGSTIDEDDTEGWTDEEIHDWVIQQNESMFFGMDRQTQKEVIDVVEKLDPGGLDRGGMWEMARMLAHREKHYGLHLDNGDKKNNRNKSRTKQTSATASSPSPPVTRRRRRR